MGVFFSASDLIGEVQRVMGEMFHTRGGIQSTCMFLLLWYSVFRI